MTQNLKRWVMRQTLTEQPVDEIWSARPITQRDGPVLGKLMYDAYHGTIDDEGETPEESMLEIEGTLAGKYGSLLATCSFLIENDGNTLGASILTDWSNERTGKKQPLLAFLMVKPDAQGKGIATFLLKKSVNALLAQSEKELVLFVTVGNSAAQHIYQKLGFQVEEEFDTNHVKSD